MVVLGTSEMDLHDWKGGMFASQDPHDIKFCLHAPSILKLQNVGQKTATCTCTRSDRRHKWGYQYYHDYPKWTRPSRSKSFAKFAVEGLSYVYIYMNMSMLLSGKTLSGERFAIRLFGWANSLDKHFGHQPYTFFGERTNHGATNSPATSTTKTTTYKI